MAKIFVSDYPNRSGQINVWRADQEYKADLSFFEVDQEYKATHDGLWFFVKQDYQSTVKIYWVDHENQADLKVFKVDQDYKAKWHKSHALRNRL